MSGLADRVGLGSSAFGEVGEINCELVTLRCEKKGQTSFAVLATGERSASVVGSTCRSVRNRADGTRV